MCDVALIEKEVPCGLTKSDILYLFDKLKITDDSTEVYLLEVDNPNGASSAMGFIKAEMAETLDYDYESCGLNRMIQDVLADVDNENVNKIYVFKGIEVYLTR